MVVCGEPFKQVGSTLDHAGPGEVAVSNEVWELLKGSSWSHKHSRPSTCVVLNKSNQFYIHGDTAHPDYVPPFSARKEILETLRKESIPDHTATIIRCARSVAASSERCAPAHASRSAFSCSRVRVCNKQIVHTRAGVRGSRR